jgi:hypothetical protein
VAAATLRAAADHLDRAQVVSYRGSFRDDSDKTSDFDLQTTPGGWGRGSLQDDGRTVRLLTADDNLMIKAEKSYWTAKDYSGTTLKRFSGRWIDSQAELPDAESLTAPLAPSNVAGLMREAADGARVSVGAQTTVGGTRAQRLYTPAGRYYVTTAKPYTLVRIESASTSSATGTQTGLGGKPLPDGIDATVTELTGSEDSSFRSSFRSELGALRTAVDPAVTFSTVGKSSFSPCGNSGCTAKFKIKNAVYKSLSTDPGGPVHAMITIDITLDGRKVKHCTYEKTMKAQASVTLGCRATYSASTSSNHTVRGLPDAWARAVTDAELKQLTSDFAKGKSTSSGGTGTSA